jgi:hypothetical protein
MGGTKSAILGLEPTSNNAPASDDPSLRWGGNDKPGAIGVDEAIPLDLQRMIAKVTKDWEPPNPRSTPEIVVHGKTIPEVFNSLNNAQPSGEWGQGGGQLQADDPGPGNSTNLTISVHAGLVYRLPKWAEYDSASAGKKGSWDRMFAKLKAHEDRHLAIAIEEANKLAADLVGKEIRQIPSLVTAANNRMQSRQIKLDSDTQNGARAGVPFGDVILDDVE